MNYVDIIAILIISLSAFNGFRKGVIKSFFKLIIFLCITIISYRYRSLLTNLFVKYLPFFNFGGKLKGLFSANFLIYDVLAFIILFIILYSVFNIIFKLSGIVDFLIKITIIFDLPSRILGLLIGIIKGVMIVFILSFIMLQINQTQKYVMESKIAKPIIDNTPIFTNVFKQAIDLSEKIYNIVQKNHESDDKTEVNLDIMDYLIKNNVIDDKTIQKAIDKYNQHFDENITILTGDL